jgi:hypothetical protein
MASITAAKCSPILQQVHCRLISCFIPVIFSQNALQAVHLSMTRPIATIIMCSVLFLATACSRKTSYSKPMVEGQAPEVIRTDSAWAVPATTDYTIDSARISQRAGLLYVYVNYSGGCATHRFEAVTPGSWSKSVPAQLPVYIRHNNGGDACRESLSKTLVYDIRSLHPAGAKEVEFIIGSFKLRYLVQ